jgi:hypothetical protein
MVLEKLKPGNLPAGARNAGLIVLGMLLVLMLGLSW